MKTGQGVPVTKTGRVAGKSENVNLLGISGQESYICDLQTMKFIIRLSLAITPYFFTLMAEAQVRDWPMWRSDHGRSASTTEQLADNLHLQWKVQYSPRTSVWDDPLNQNLMQFDKLFEPIVAGNKIFLGFNDQDKVIALDINAGSELEHEIKHQAYLLVSKGKITLDGHTLKQGDGAEIRDAASIKLAADTDADVLIIDVPEQARY